MCSMPSRPVILKAMSRCCAGRMISPRQAHKGQLRKTGDPYITHPVMVALMLADYGLDEQTAGRGLAP